MAIGACKADALGESSRPSRVFHRYCNGDSSGGNAASSLSFG